MTGEPTFNTDGLDVDEIGNKVLQDRRWTPTNPRSP